MPRGNYARTLSMQVVNFTLALCGGYNLDEALCTCTSILGKCFVTNLSDVDDLAS